MDEKERLRLYVVDFMNREEIGGYTEVAKKSGINRQTLKHVDSGRNAPGVDILRGIALAYPNEFDLFEAVTGEPLKRGGAVADNGSSENYVPKAVFDAQMKAANQTAEEERVKREAAEREARENKSEAFNAMKNLAKFMAKQAGEPVDFKPRVSKKPAIVSYVDARIFIRAQLRQWMPMATNQEEASC